MFNEEPFYKANKSYVTLKMYILSNKCSPSVCLKCGYQTHRGYVAALRVMAKKNTSKHVKTSKSPLIQVIHISVVNSPDPEASDL